MQITKSKRLRSALVLSLCAAMLFSCSGKDGASLGTTPAVTTPATDNTDTNEILSLPDYDFYSLDISKYVKAPEDYLTRDYTEGLKLMGEPTDAAVTAAIKTKYLKKLAEATTVDENSTVRDYDVVIMDYCGKLNDVQFDGGTASDTEHEICLDASTFIEGFDVGLIGMKVGETKDLHLTFPDPYTNNPSLAGKEVVFTVTIDKITRYEYPELTDKLIADNPDIFGKEYTSAEQLVSDIRAQITESYKQYDNELITNAAWEYLSEHLEITEYPADILLSYENVIQRSHELQAKQSQLTYDVYVVQKGYLSVEDFKDKVITRTAKDILSEKLLIYFLADAFDLVVTNEQARELAQEEFKAYIEPYISYYSVYYGISDLESYLNYMGGIGSYRDNILFSHALEKLCGIENEEESESPEEDNSTETGADTEAQ